MKNQTQKSNQKWIGCLAGAMVVILLSACSAEIKGANTTPPPPPENQQKPFPEACTDYSGKYMMNMDLFNIQQTKCEEINWVYEVFPGQPEKSAKYIPNGLPYEVNGQLLRTYFEQGNLMIGYADKSNNQILQKLSFQKKPCNLYNPDGQDFLTLETWVNGQYSESGCQFWAKRAQ